MKKSLILFAALLVCAGWTVAAQAANDCCWDLAAGVGAGDQPPPTLDKNPSPPDPGNGAPFGWAQCTPTPAANCFARTGIQEIWHDWHCVAGSASPNGALPGPNPGNGFACEEKVTLVDVSHSWGGPPWDNTFPALQHPLNTAMSQEQAAGLPGTSPVALGIVVLLLLTAGAWILARNRKAGSAMA